MKKTLTTIFYVSMLVSFAACSKKEQPAIDLPYAQFDGQIGNFSFYTKNSVRETFIKTIGFNNGNYIFKLEFEGTGSAGFTNERFVLSLTNVIKKRSFNLFEPYTDEKDRSVDGVYFYNKRADDVAKFYETKLYTTIKNKNSIRVNIDSIAYKELKIPSLIGKIKGYLFNLDNPKDSILVDATFRTQASE